MVFHTHLYKCVCKLSFDADTEPCMKLCLTESIALLSCDHKETFFVPAIDTTYFHTVDCKGLGTGDRIVEFFCIVRGTLRLQDLRSKPFLSYGFQGS